MRGGRAFPEPSANEVDLAVVIEVGGLHPGVGVADHVGFLVGYDSAGGENRFRPRADVHEQPDRSPAVGDEKVKVAIVVNIDGIKLGGTESEILAIGLEGDTLGKLNVLKIPPVTDVAEEHGELMPGSENVLLAVAIPVDHGNGHESAAQRLVLLGRQFAPPGKGQSAAKASGILVYQEFAGLRPVSHAAEEILVAVAVPVVKGDRHPSPAVVLMAREHENLAVRGEAAAVDHAVVAGVLIALDERFHPALEQIEIAVAVKIAERIEPAGINLTSVVALSEEVTVPDEGQSSAEVSPSFESRVSK